jgi:hypothetical protein
VSEINLHEHQSSEHGSDWQQTLLWNKTTRIAGKRKKRKKTMTYWRNDMLFMKQRYGFVSICPGAVSHKTAACKFKVASNIKQAPCISLNSLNCAGRQPALIGRKLECPLTPFKALNCSRRQLELRALAGILRQISCNAYNIPGKPGWLTTGIRSSASATGRDLELGTTLHCSKD